MAIAKRSKTHPKIRKTAKKRVSNERRYPKKTKIKKTSKKNVKRHRISREKVKQSRISIRKEKSKKSVSKSEIRKREIAERTKRTREIVKRGDLLQKNKVGYFSIPGLVTADRIDTIRDFQQFEKAKGIRKEKLQNRVDRGGDKFEESVKRVTINRKTRNKRGEKILTKKGERKPISKDNIAKFDKSLKLVSDKYETAFLVGDNNLGLQTLAGDYDEAIKIISKLSVMPGAFLQIQVIPQDEILEKYFSDRPFSSTMFREIPNTPKRDVIEISLENIITSYKQNGWGIKEIRINYHVT
jgi:hypothetical protein